MEGWLDERTIKVSFNCVAMIRQLSGRLQRGWEPGQGGSELKL